jgi:hypothetical protein
MIHTLGPAGQRILQTLGGMAMILSLVLLVLVQFIESIRRRYRIFTPALFYVLFTLCMALMIVDLLFTNHHPRQLGGPDG